MFKRNEKPRSTPDYYKEEPKKRVIFNQTLGMYPS